MKNTNDSVTAAGWCFGAMVAIAALGSVAYQLYEAFK